MDHARGQGASRERLPWSLDSPPVLAPQRAVICTLFWMRSLLRAKARVLHRCPVSRRDQKGGDLADKWARLAHQVSVSLMFVSSWLETQRPGAILSHRSRG